MRELTRTDSSFRSILQRGSLLAVLALPVLHESTSAQQDTAPTAARELNTPAQNFPPVVSSPVATGSLTQRAIDHEQRIEQYQQTVERLQSEVGPFDQSLIEPLESLTAIFIESENYEDAIALLDQQLQIQRINNGLYTTRQLPVVEAQLRLRAASGDWDKVSDTLQYLSWIYQRDTTLSPEEQLVGLKQLGSWHLTALGQDAREHEAFHLVELRNKEEQARELAEEHYGKTSEALVPFVYDEALADLYIGLAIMLTGETSQDLMLMTEGIRSRSPAGSSVTASRSLTEADIEALYGSRASTVIERSFKNNMSANLTHLKRIREIYSASGNLEAEAMSLMYMGDSTLLRQQYENRPGNFAGVRRGTTTPGPALDYYGEALAMLTTAGLPDSVVAEFTQCPVLLPITVFHDNLQDARPQCEHQQEPPLYDLGVYSLMSTLIPGLEGSPELAEGQLEATLTFTVRSNGQVGNNEILTIEPDNTPNRVRVRKLTELMQFRPALHNGRAARTENVRLRVRMPAAQ
ncbi:MAG: hypothetical protein Q8L20_01425 [Gammaproteobacteria bacterium]|nr:hypothetical protein [Gammaproteobacteria bacterium]